MGDTIPHLRTATFTSGYFCATCVNMMTRYIRSLTCFCAKVNIVGDTVPHLKTVKLAGIFVLCLNMMTRHIYRSAFFCSKNNIVGETVP